MLTFLFGRPGSGKTSYIINKIKSSVAENRRCYLLVPEQQAYISECMLADLMPSSALCFEVVTFSRLCSIVFGKFGGLTATHISSGARQLIMWQSLRETAEYLRAYKGVKIDASLSSMFLSAIDELRANSIDADKCEELSEKCDDQTLSDKLSDKLSDISMLYANFNRNLEARAGADALASENKLSRLAEVLSENDFFAGCDIYIDSFTSFTAEEHAVLSEIIAQADNVCISIPMKARRFGEAHEESISSTVKKLTLTASRRSVEHADVVLGENLRASGKELRVLEEELWNFSLTDKKRPSVAESERGKIEMYVCANEYDEIRLAALRIIEEHSAGKRFSEIALIMRDCEARKGIVDAIFSELGIPYFYSDRTDLSTTPIARLILSALRCVSLGFRHEDVSCLVKTGLCGLSPEDADMFEDYCRTWSISGKLFEEKVWSMNPDGYIVKLSQRGEKILKSANRARKIIIDPLLRLRDALRDAAGVPKDSCRAIYAYLKDIGISQSLSELAELYLSSGNVKEAGEILRIYDFTVSVLTEISAVLDGTYLSPDELSSAIEIMLKNTDIGSVPALNDYVTVGSADTLRIEGIKTAILVGLCEGEFPAGFSERGLIAESDKRILEDMGIDFTSRESSVLSDELFFAYRAMTKPSEKLILCTRSKNVGGGSPTPSSAWTRVKYIFDYIAPKQFDYIKLLEAFKRRSDVSERDPEDPVGSDDIIDALKDNEFAVAIDPDYARLILGERLYLSKSRISAFAECPYKFWCECIIRLRENKTTSINYADAGTIIHYVLEKFISRIRNEDGSLNRPSDDQVISAVETILYDHISDIKCPLPPSTMYSFSRLRDTALVMVKSILDEFKDSRFKVLALEKQIDDEKAGALKPMEIKVYDTEELPIVSLGGVIDRIDCYDDGARKYIRVVDYKTGSHKYNVKKIESGEDLQLPAYLFTATTEENEPFFGDGGKPFAAAALFLSADEQRGEIIPVRSGFMLKDREFLRAASGKSDSKMLAGIKINDKDVISGNSAIPEEDIESLNSILQSTIANTARDMYSGKACRTPSDTACTFCSLRASCPVANK